MLAQGFLPQFQQIAQATCKKMEAHVGTGFSFDARPLLGDYAAEAICQTVFSDEWEPEMHAIRAQFVKQMLVAPEVLFYRIMRPWLVPDAAFFWSSRRKEYNEAARVVDTFVSTVLSHKMEQVTLVFITEQKNSRPNRPIKSNK